MSHTLSAISLKIKIKQTFIQNIQNTTSVPHYVLFQKPYKLRCREKNVFSVFSKTQLNPQLEAFVL